MPLIRVNDPETLEHQLQSDQVWKVVSLWLLFNRDSDVINENILPLSQAREYIRQCPCFLADDPMAAKMLSYNRANRAVAVLCNHQRAVPKNFSAQMERMNEKITAKKHELKEANKALKDAKAQAKASRAATVQTWVWSLLPVKPLK